MEIVNNFKKSRKYLEYIKTLVSLIKFKNMKKIFFLLIVLLPTICFSQKDEKSDVVNYVESVVKKHVVFVSYETYGDTIKVTQFSIYDFQIKDYIRYQKKDIELKYPILSTGFTLKTDIPSGGSVRSDVNNLYSIFPINLLDRPYTNFSSW